MISLDIQTAYPTAELTKEETQSVLDRVRDIVSRGKAVKFTRPHRILSDETVTKIVVDATQHEFGDLKALNGGFVALWDATYTLEEIERPE